MADPEVTFYDGQWRAKLPAAEASGGGATASPASLAFVQRAERSGVDLLPPALQTLAERFAADTGWTKWTGNTQPITAFNGGLLTFSNNVATDRHTVWIKDTAPSLTVPQFFVEVHVTARVGGGGGYANVGCGFCKDSNNAFSLVRDGVNGVVNIYTTIGGGNAGFGFGAWQPAHTGPFKLGLSCVGNTLCAFGDVGAGWVFIGSCVVGGLISLNWAGWKPQVTYSSNLIGSYTVSQLNAGSFGGTGIRDLSIVIAPDGTPRIVDDEVYCTATRPDPTGAAYQAVVKVNLLTWAITQTATIFNYRAGGAQCDLAGQIVAHEDGTRRLTLGTWSSLSNILDVRTQHKLVSAELLSGVHLVTGMTQLNLPSEAGEAVYDANIAWDGTQWICAYTTRSGTSAVADPFYPNAASSPDLVTWTRLGRDRMALQYEGTKLFKLNTGPFWITAGTRHAARLYDHACNFRGYMQLTVNGGDPSGTGNQTFPHCPVFWDAERSRYVVLTFDKTQEMGSLSTLFNWGRMIAHTT